MLGATAATGISLIGNPVAHAQAPSAVVDSIASADPTASSILIWAHSTAPGTMVIQISTRADFLLATDIIGPLFSPGTDFTARYRLTGLEPSTHYYYRVANYTIRGGRSPWKTGRCRTAPNTAQPISIAWSGDVCGQGWGINPAIGGMTIFSAIAQYQPDVFIHNGDSVYADNPMKASVTLPDGRAWTNITTPAKNQIAQSLTEYRGQYAYNHLDHNYEYFSSNVTQVVQWDDHEVLNNWFPHQIQYRSGYTEHNVDILAARAFQAFTEWQPINHYDAVDGRVFRTISYGPLLDIFLLDMRSYKDPNYDDWNPNGSHMFGTRQTEWLINSLRTSTAAWKIVSNDLPLGIVVTDPYSNIPGHKPSMESIAQGDNGQPLGREVELAHILTSIRDIPNIVWVTTDVHYSAAVYFDPNKASFKEFSPFWQFVSGPLNAGSFPANPLDATFGPEYVYVHAPDQPNSSPLDDYQHFGTININPANKDLTVNLRDKAGRNLYEITLPHK